MLARFVHALLGAVPASLVGRSRTFGGGARAVEALVALVGRPLEGRTVAIPRGEARGISFRAERRSLAWITGKVEPEVQRALRSLVAPGATFVDAGASIGFFTVLGARLVGPAGRVVAFEPNGAAAAAIRTNADLNGFENVVIVPKALSDRDGYGFLDGRAGATSALVDVPTPTATRVRTTSLDTFLSERSELAPHVVKIDVEGHEAAVLRGMAATLKAVRPVVIVEMHGDRRFLSILDEAGYTCSVVEGYVSPTDAPSWAHVLGLPADYS
ncbi:MAG: FkbM family methyltransferase [Thermoleophilaceae bacterium]|nr:FkbM family methyltransferase [Thermoleophilaceae bacterium]